VMQCCTKSCFCLECAVSVVLSVRVGACASLRHRHNPASVQVSCSPGSGTAPPQPVRAGSVTQSLWNGERLAARASAGTRQGVSRTQLFGRERLDARFADGELMDSVAALTSCTGKRGYWYRVLSYLA